jgi:hypothetical protein
VLFSFIRLEYIELFERILTAGKLRELRDGTGRDETGAGRDGTRRDETGAGRDGNRNFQNLEL